MSVDPTKRAIADASEEKQASSSTSLNPNMNTNIGINSSNGAHPTSDGNIDPMTNPAPTTPRVVTNSIADRLEIEAQIAKQHYDFDYSNSRTTRRSSNTSNYSYSGSSRVNVSQSYRQYYDEMRGTSNSNSTGSMGYIREGRENMGSPGSGSGEEGYSPGANGSLSGNRLGLNPPRSNVRLRYTSRASNAASQQAPPMTGSPPPIPLMNFDAELEYALLLSQQTAAGASLANRLSSNGGNSVNNSSSSINSSNRSAAVTATSTVGSLLPPAYRASHPAAPSTGTAVGVPVLPTEHAPEQRPRQQQQEREGVDEEDEELLNELMLLEVC